MTKHGPPVYSHNWYDGGYTPDFVLRPGESVERFFQPQGYWRFADSYKEGSSRKIVGRDPRGPKSGGYSENTYGNARFDYEPKIAAGYADYAQGVWSDQNVALAEKGLVLAADGPGFQHVLLPVPLHHRAAERRPRHGGRRLGRLGPSLQDRREDRR